MIKRVYVAAALLLASTGLAAQKRPDRPKVHAEFYFGSIPPAKEARAALAQEKARMVLVAFHEGWSDNKIAKELKIPQRDVDNIHGDLSDLGLLGKRVTDVVPSILVIRDRDAEELETTLERHTRDFAIVAQSILPDLDAILSTAPGAKDLPPERRLYAALVGGVLFGGMIDVLSDDKTFMPAPPAHGNAQYYGWLVESAPALAGTIQRESWDSEKYQMISVGPALLEERPDLDEIRRSGFVLEENEARRFRSVALVASRDKLLPFFKTQRDDFLKAHRRVESGKYSPFKNFFAWYYTALVNRTVDRLVASGRLATPAKTEVYALKSLTR